MSGRRKAKEAAYVPPWFRLYHEIIEDPKLAPLSEAKRWRFLVALVMNHRGQVPCDDQAAAYLMRISLRDAGETRKQLTARGLIRGQWVSPAFQKRQHIVSDHSTSRVRAYRERQKNKHLVESNSEKRVTETAQSREEESRKEKKRAEGQKNGNGPASPRHSPLPADFDLTPERAAIAQAGGHDAEKTFRKFKLDSKRKGRKSLDWDSEWGLWCERERPSETKSSRRASTTIELALREKPDGSDSEIAELAGKSEEEVRQTRSELARVH